MVDKPPFVDLHSLLNRVTLNFLKESLAELLSWPPCDVEATLGYKTKARSSLLFRLQQTVQLLQTSLPPNAKDLYISDSTGLQRITSLAEGRQRRQQEFSGIISRDLHWENKTYMLKRSVHAAFTRSVS